ncbi:MAG TPA: hypothetical protein VKQ36_06305 [Ktedonobacterales bacterium]|nr:hypothetical protein [Ktedonobacterales bacterium]
MGADPCVSLRGVTLASAPCVASVSPGGETLTGLPAPLAASLAALFGWRVCGGSSCLPAASPLTTCRLIVLSSYCSPDVWLVPVRHLVTPHG